MNPPVVDAADVHPEWVFVTWTPLTDTVHTGRDPAIFYSLEWDRFTNSVTWFAVFT